MTTDPLQVPSKIMVSETMRFKETNATRSWSDMPVELLAQILIHLGLIDLLSFRGTCKEWRAASDLTKAQNESCPDFKPWLLLYGKGDESDPQPILWNAVDTKKYKIDIPELKGAHCLASFKGWLLLHYENGSLIFFCPFSRSKIALPELPILKISGHVAVLSAPPTSEDCVVCVINRRDESTMDLHVLHRGDEKWEKIEKPYTEYRFGHVTGAIYDNTNFNFLDKNNKMLTYNGNKEWRSYTIIESRSKEYEQLNFCYRTRYFEETCVGKLAELEGGASISTCGTVVSRPAGILDLVIHNESVDAYGESEKVHCLNGIWIHPRFCHIGSNQTWSLK